MIGHPDKRQDVHAFCIAGLEAQLLVYESILKSEPDTRAEDLDVLVELRNRGQLSDYIAKQGKP
jgi:hypothetical protein